MFTLVQKQQYCFLPGQELTDSGPQYKPTFVWPTSYDFDIFKWLHVKWLYKFLYNILSFASWSMKPIIFIFWLFIPQKEKIANHLYYRLLEYWAKLFKSFFIMSLPWWLRS